MSDALYFFPSQVNLNRMFVGTFGRAEAENTAAVIVQVLASNGDIFRSATCEELSAGFGELTREEGFWRSWFNNPFMRIDTHDLVDRGFAAWDGDRAIRVTDQGLSRMRKWVRESRQSQSEPIEEDLLAESDPTDDSLEMFQNEEPTL